MKTAICKYARIIIASITSFLIPNIVYGQILFGYHEFEDMLYNAHVKSLDEFIQRFNGIEISPMLANDDTNKVQKNRFLLFDYDLVKDISFGNDSIPSIYEKFIYDVGTDSIAISIEDPHNWIEAICEFKWKNSAKTLTLKMQLEESDDHCWRWAIIDVDGLEESGLLEDEGILQISPVEHEINFIGLESLFLHDYSKIVATRKTGAPIDHLSFFYGLVYSEELKYVGCKCVEFHCGQIPNYFFIVKEINRMNSTNSGWLIKSLSKNKNNDNEK